MLFILNTSPCTVYRYTNPSLRLVTVLGNPPPPRSFPPGAWASLGLVLPTGTLLLPPHNPSQWTSPMQYNRCLSPLPAPSLRHSFILLPASLLPLENLHNPRHPVFPRSPPRQQETMKFLVPLTLLVAAGVSAQDQECDADYIVSRCLTDETQKASSTPFHS